MDMTKLAKDPDAFEKLSADLRRKDAERLAAMSPEEREAELKRREDRRREEEELDKATVSLRYHCQEMDGLGTIICDLQMQLAELTDKALEKIEAQEAELAETKKLKGELLREKVMQEGELLAAAHRAKLQLDKLQAQEAELKAARVRIDALLDANLKAQDVRRKLDRIEAKADEVKKDVGDIGGKVNETQIAATKTLKAIDTAREDIGKKVQRAIGGVGVRVDHLKESVEKRDDALGDLRRTQLDTLAAVGEIRDGKTADGKPTAPDLRDYQMTTKALSHLLEEKNCKRSTRQIELWEKYLKTNGREGTRPPSGYSLSTRLTPETAAAWVKTYAADEATKNAVRVHFDDRRHQRPK